MRKGMSFATAIAAAALVSLGMAGIGVANAGAAQAGTAQAGQSPPIPPDLAAFEERGESLHLKSVRFHMTFEEAIDIRVPHHPSFVFDLPFDAEGEAAISPSRAVVHIDGPGQDGEVRVVDGAVYSKRPEGLLGGTELAAKRPWTRKPGGQLGSSGVDPLALSSGIEGEASKAESEGSVPSSEDSLSGIASAFAKASSITEVGPEIVNGSQATEFAAQLEPSVLLGGAGVLKKLEADLAKGGDGGTASAELDVFFAPDGLPARTSWSLAFGTAARITVSIDILATEVPVEVVAPPAQKTIAAARLQKLEAAQKKRELAEKRRGRKAIQRIKRCVKTAHEAHESTKKCVEAAGPTKH